MIAKLKRLIVGAPRDIEDPQVFHKLSLVAFLAWVGLGSDGMSSSAYGPDEAFRALGEEHRYMAVFLAIAVAFTVFVISFAYSRIIEHFPTGGGGYLVATKLLGRPAGVVSGSALLIDYVLTITVSIASGAEAIFAFLPQHYHAWKIPVEFAAIIGLIVMNLRGVKESVKILIPIFLLFVVTHAVMLIAALLQHITEVPAIVSRVASQANSHYQSMGAWPLFLIFARAFSQGAGTFTGIEAVSNGLAIMREPRVATGKRTMLYMALSLAITASGILFAYLLLDVRVDPANPSRPLNAVLLENLTRNSFVLGSWFVVLTLVAEAALLLLAAQTGFIDGPRVMANMALDSWLPHRFSSLSERLTTHYGIVLIGAAALAALIYTHGDVRTLVIMYSINVFITFSLTELGMSKMYITQRGKLKDWKRALPVHLTGLILCSSILGIVVFEKFSHGAWVTLVVTSMLVGLCVLIQRYYRRVYAKLGLVPIEPELKNHLPEPPLKLDPKKPTGALLVGGYGPLGIHALTQIRRIFGDLYGQIIFVSVGVIDSGNFKGSDEVEALKKQTQESLDQYVAFARRQGLAATSMTMLGNEPVEPAAELCAEIALRHKNVMFFAGKLVFKREGILQRLLHNETAIAIQNRLQWLGYPMLILPVRVWGMGKIIDASHFNNAPQPAAAPVVEEPRS